jgi:hypothetical protein
MHFAKKFTYYVQNTEMKNKYCNKSKDYLGLHASISCVHFEFHNMLKPQIGNITKT